MSVKFQLLKGAKAEIQKALFRAPLLSFKRQRTGEFVFYFGKFPIAILLQVQDLDINRDVLSLVMLDPHSTDGFIKHEDFENLPQFLRWLRGAIW